MIYLFVAVLLFGATAAIVFALNLRKQEQGTRSLRDRIGVQAPSRWRATGGAALG